MSTSVTRFCLQQEPAASRDTGHKQQILPKRICDLKGLWYRSPDLGAVQPVFNSKVARQNATCNQWTCYIEELCRRLPLRSASGEPPRRPGPPPGCQSRTAAAGGAGAPPRAAHRCPAPPAGRPAAPRRPRSDRARSCTSGDFVKEMLTGSQRSTLPPRRDLHVMTNRSFSHTDASTAL